MPASRLRTFLELSIDGAERADSIIRRHSCAWQAVSDSQAKSSGSSSRPSGVIRRSPRKEKPAQGPVKSIRWCGSNSIMPRSHPWPGTEDAGKSRARGPAIAMRSRQRPILDGYVISHNVYYVQGDPGVAGTHLASIPSPAVAWSLIVRDRNLTGPWAGFSFKGGRLVTPEGRELYPEDLAWLSLTAAQAQEWRRMMGQASGRVRHPDNKQHANRAAFPDRPAAVVQLCTVLANRTKRSAMAMAGPDAEPPTAVLPVPGPKRRQRV